ncbi:MAG: hypothetical protein PHI90_02745, partial [Clostridia bacterium]|nr:hypothetical protein [Clostridia bacterium]
MVVAIVFVMMVMQCITLAASSNSDRDNSSREKTKSNITSATASAVTETDTDTEAPTVPQGINGRISKGTYKIFWSESKDNVKVTGYEVYRDGEKIATTTRAYYRDKAISPKTAYAFYVKAYDDAGNISEASETIIANPEYYTGEDTEAPTVPQDVRGKELGSTYKIYWEASKDDIGLKEYEIYQDGEKIATTKETN